MLDGMLNSNQSVDECWLFHTWFPHGKLKIIDLYVVLGMSIQGQNLPRSSIPGSFYQIITENPLPRDVFIWTTNRYKPINNNLIGMA